ncbi:MAG: N-acetylglucosamine-6-phosphate deacetylase, partial [Candidatus Latescibacteria bacterium]|nr:N-acetylglucosamine-6-phosphate deacetylase [Candidatus Latescibacterota bacterium]
MSERLVLKGGDAVLYEGVMHDSVVIVDNGSIANVCPAENYLPADRDRIVDCSGHFVCPGFIDLHNQGGGGYTVLDGSEEHVFGMCRAHAKHGTTGLLLTPPIEMFSYRVLLPELAAAVGKDTGGAAVLGIHAEGPFVNPAKKGCMSDHWIHDPDRAML